MRRLLAATILLTFAAIAGSAHAASVTINVCHIIKGDRWHEGLE